MNELISVIVPVYNVEPYIKRCLESLINQTYQNIEIIVINDGSTDGSGDICNSYVQKDNRVFAIHKENKGLSDARNCGLAIAKGSLVSFVDSDDYVAPNYLEVLYDALKNTKAQISICGIKCFSEMIDVSPLKKIKAKPYIIKKPLKALEDVFYYKKGAYSWGKLFYVDLFKNIKYPVGKTHEDMAIIHLLFLKCNKIVYCNEKLYFYLLRANSITHSNFSDSTMDAVEIALDVNNYIENNCLDLKIAVKSMLLSKCFFALLKIKDKNKYREEWEYIISIISKYRKYVLFDPKSRKKTWTACLLSYFIYK